jgi:hypothetical protein
LKEDLFNMSTSAVSGPSSAATTNTHPETKPPNTPQPSNRTTAQDTVNISNAGQQAARQTDKTNAGTDSDSDGH